MIRRVLVFALAMVLASASAYAATVKWSAPAKYANDANISTSDRAKIVYEVYTGTTASGPWTSAGTTAAGATTFAAPDPVAGATLWYAVDATLNGQRSTKGSAVSKTVPFPVPSCPTGITVE